MLDRLRRHLTYANVVSSACLFIVLGGTSYAVTTGAIDSREIKNNTVRSKDIRNNTVLGRDIRDRAIRNGDVGPNALRGDRILESSLGAVPSSVFAANASRLEGRGAAAFLPVERVKTTGGVAKLTGGPSSASPTERVLFRSGPFALRLECYVPSVPGRSLRLVVETTAPNTRVHFFGETGDDGSLVQPPGTTLLTSNASTPTGDLRVFSIEAPSGAAAQGMVRLGLNDLGSDCSATAFAIG